MVGVANNLNYYENNDYEILATKITELKDSDLLKTTSSGKVSSKNRNSKRIELAKSFFKID